MGQQTGQAKKVYYPLSLYLQQKVAWTGQKHLRACPPEDQAEVIHAITPISVKLGQIEGHTQ